MNNIPEILVLHHSLSDFKGDQINIINQYHKERWGMLSSLGWYVGYHFVIEKSGKVTQTRATNEEGVHAIGWNFKSLGICLAGDFTKEMPTKEQVDAVIELKKKYSLPLKFHREVQEYRTCPGPINKDMFDLPILPVVPDEEIQKAQNIQKQISLLTVLVSRLSLAIKLLLGK